MSKPMFVQLGVVHADIYRNAGGRPEAGKLAFLTAWTTPENLVELQLPGDVRIRVTGSEWEFLSASIARALGSAPVAGDDGG